MIMRGFLALQSGDVLVLVLEDISTANHANM